VSPRKHRERGHESLVALLLLARRFFSRFDAREAIARAFDGTNFTQRESFFFFFFLFFCGGKVNPFREIPSKKRGDSRGAFSGRRNVSDVKLRVWNNGEMDDDDDDDDGDAFESA